MNDNDKIPLSYLSQYYFCKRRAALLLIEQAWEENVYTAEGREEHNRVHTARIEKRGELVKLYETIVISEKLNLSGKCDCIEAKIVLKDGTEFPFLDGVYQLYPVEYKHGRQRIELEYHIQVCAQAMCLEEMYDCRIEKGAIFYIDAHRRVEVLFDAKLRQYVIEGAKELCKMLQEEVVPLESYSSKCKKCSLVEYCIPKIKTSLDTYMKQVKLNSCTIEEVGKGEETL